MYSFFVSPDERVLFCGTVQLGYLCKSLRCNRGSDIRLNIESSENITEVAEIRIFRLSRVTRVTEQVLERGEIPSMMEGPQPSEYPAIERAQRLAALRLGRSKVKIRRQLLSRTYTGTATTENEQRQLPREV